MKYYIMKHYIWKQSIIKAEGYNNGKDNKFYD